MLSIIGSGNFYMMDFKWLENEKVFEYCKGNTWMKIDPLSMKIFCVNMLKFIEENNLTK
jgi:hypothetical protein